MIYSVAYSRASEPRVRGLAKTVSGDLLPALTLNADLRDEVEAWWARLEPGAITRPSTVVVGHLQPGPDSFVTLLCRRLFTVILGPDGLDTFVVDAAPTPVTEDADQVAATRLRDHPFTRSVLCQHVPWGDEGAPGIVGDTHVHVPALPEDFGGLGLPDQTLVVDPSLLADARVRALMRLRS